MKRAVVIISVVGSLIATLTAVVLLMLNVEKRVSLKAVEFSIPSDAKSIMFSVRNNSLRTIYYGEGFVLEKWDIDSHAWLLYDDKPDQPKTEHLGQMYNLPLQEKKLQQWIALFSDNFESGRYRVLHEICYDEERRDGKSYYKRFNVYGEFEVSTTP